VKYDDHFKVFAAIFKDIKVNGVDVRGLACKVYISATSDTLELQYSSDSDKIVRLNAINNAFKEIITA
jgi:hypothetical protein